LKRLLFALCLTGAPVFGQTLDAVAGVRLEGNPWDPIAVNGSGESILALKVEIHYVGNQPPKVINKLFPHMGKMMAPGARIRVSQIGPMTLKFGGTDVKTGARVGPETVVTGAKLTGVVFADGRFVGSAPEWQVQEEEAQFQRFRNTGDRRLRHSPDIEKSLPESAMQLFKDAEQSGDMAKVGSMEEYYQNLPDVHRTALRFGDDTTK
jgi:hypothetical protein